MTTPQQPQPEDDNAADTQSFRAFAEARDEEPVGGPLGSSFRIVTLLIGLLVLAGLIYLMFRL